MAGEEVFGRREIGVGGTGLLVATVKEDLGGRDKKDLGSRRYQSHRSH